MLFFVAPLSGPALFNRGYAALTQIICLAARKEDKTSHEGTPTYCLVEE